ncbi:hypothetical protein [Mycobacterium deserti]|uniref:Mce-associated membrane protein n=1 Tax=Mycobacterium deserti TaxID=2978347 RepID=A0ABT2MHJ2_9MYCO|nr:hypothetical protein [Mycobacterium deserti]MCT7660555.1 hypothetical protein [Mycobacterium deserti]
MPSFRRRASVIDADHVDKTPKKPDAPADASDALALAEEAEAEAAEAEAVAAAARAKARAIRLRREAAAASEPAEPASEVAAESATDTENEATTAEEPETATSTDPEVAADVAAEGDAGDSTDGVAGKARRRRRPRIRWKTLAAVLAVLCTVALIVLSVVASVLMYLDHKNQLEEQRLMAEYSAAARQGVVTLMSLDFNNAQEDVQRIIDNTTGQFRDEFERQAGDFAEVARQSKVITEANVNIAAVKTMNDDTAQVLVSATSHVTNSAGANREPRSWRLLVDLDRDGDRIKMSKVEFVP